MEQATGVKFRIKQFVKIIVQHGILPVFYFFGKLRRVNPQYMIFADFHKSEVPYSMEDLYAVLKADPRYRVETMTKDCDHASWFSVFAFMIRFMLRYARAGYVFICDNFLPVASCRKRPETTVVQMWHAGGMLKKYAYDTGRDIPTYYKGNVFRNYSLIITSNEICNSAYVSGMRADPETVHGLGLSRTDRFYDENYKAGCREEFLKAYPEAEGKKIALWAPTFRGNASVPEGLSSAFVEDLRKNLGDSWMLITKSHPHLQKHLGPDACSIPTEKLLPVTDVLISDYSSVIYDYLLLERPLVLYAPDLDRFIEEDQFYIDYYEMPGEIVKDPSGLADAVLHAEERTDREKLSAFREKYMGACDGHALERLLTYLGLK